MGPEDLVLFKILAFRARDLDDVAAVLERRYTRLDWKLVFRWASELRIANLLEQVVTEYVKSAGLANRLPWL